MIEEHLSLPFATTVLGVPVTVERVQLTLRDEIVAVCRRARTRQTIPLLDLPLPSPPPAGSEWIAAYRHWLQGGSRERPYDDGFTDGGFLRYRYHGTDPNHRDNVGLRTAMQRQTPLIYLRGIVQGLYGLHRRGSPRGPHLHRGDRRPGRGAGRLAGQRPGSFFD